MAYCPDEPQSTCEPGIEQCFKKCLENEDIHLTETLPASLTPTKPIFNLFHRIKSLPQCNDDKCGQRIQLITMQGHEIRMMDHPSGASNITLTTADASQSLRLDQLNKMTWLTSKNHHFFMADAGHEDANVGEKSGHVKYLDPNNLPLSTYQLILTEKKHKIWLADTDTHPRIHAHTTKGHEVLLLDKAPQHPLGKIQITTYDKTMQIVMDLDSGDILINNFNTTGGGGNTTNGVPGSIRMYAVGEIELHAELGVGIFSNKDIVLSAPDGEIDITDNSTTVVKLPSAPGEPPVPGVIKPTVLTDLTIIDKG